MPDYSDYLDAYNGYDSTTSVPAYSTIISLNKSDEDPDNTEPATEPVTLSEAKRWLRIDLAETSEDDLVSDGITAARQQIEDYLNRSLIKRTVTVAMNIAPGGASLPYQPVISFTSATDSDGNAIDSTDYVLNGAVLQFPDNYYNRAVFVYDAGYEDITQVPMVFKRGILRLLAFDWENRGDVVNHAEDWRHNRAAQLRRVV